MALGAAALWSPAAGARPTSPPASAACNRLRHRDRAAARWLGPRSEPLPDKSRRAEDAGRSRQAGARNGARPRHPRGHAPGDRVRAGRGREASFNELKRLLGATDGNLSVHARRLEEAGYVACAKTFAAGSRKPSTA